MQAAKTETQKVKSHCKEVEEAVDHGSLIPLNTRHRAFRIDIMGRGYDSGGGRKGAQSEQAALFAASLAMMINHHALYNKALLILNES